jgi:hypothetical protein
VIASDPPRGGVVIRCPGGARWRGSRRTATALIVIQIAISAAGGLGVSPKPMLVAVRRGARGRLPDFGRHTHCPTPRVAVPFVVATQAGDQGGQHA